MAARVAFPAVQGITATIGMALAFGYTLVCACSGSYASFKKLVCPVIIIAVVWIIRVFLLRRRPSWTPSSIVQNAQGYQGGIMQTLNLDILSFHGNI